MCPRLNTTDYVTHTSNIFMHSLLLAVRIYGSLNDPLTHPFSITAVRHSAHSMSEIGHFGGGDCVIALTRIALTVSQPNDNPIAMWRYSTLRSFRYGSNLFCFVSGRRGPFGAKTYSFKVTPSVRSSLLSVISELLNMTIEYVANPEDEDCACEIGDCRVVEDTAAVPNLVNHSGVTSTCYKVAKSTFYTDLPSEAWRSGRRRGRHPFAPSSSSPSFSTPLPRRDGEWEESGKRTTTFQNLPSDLQLVIKPSKPHRALHGCASEGCVGSTNSHNCVKSLSSPIRAQMPEYLQLQPTHQEQLLHQSTRFQPLLSRYESDPSMAYVDQRNGGGGACDDVGMMEKRVRSISLDNTLNGSGVEYCVSSLYSTHDVATDDNDHIKKSDEDVAKQSSHQRLAHHCKHLVASNVESTRNGDSDQENWAVPWDEGFGKRSLQDERAAIGVVHHVVRPCSSVEYSNVCMHVRLSTEINS